MRYPFLLNLSLQLIGERNGCCPTVSEEKHASHGWLVADLRGAC